MDTARRSPYEGEGGRIAREAYIRADLKGAAVGSFLRTATPYTARCRQIIHYQGRPTTGVYFVESGRIKCVSSASDGRELLLTEFGAGEFLGVIEALSGTRAVATAVATETSMLRFVHNELFRKLIAAFPDQRQAIGEALTRWRFRPYLRNGEPIEVETGIMFGQMARPMAPTKRAELETHPARRSP